MALSDAEEKELRAQVEELQQENRRLDQELDDVDEQRREAEAKVDELQDEVDRLECALDDADNSVDEVREVEDFLYELTAFLGLPDGTSFGDVLEALRRPTKAGYRFVPTAPRWGH